MQVVSRQRFTLLGKMTTTAPLVTLCELTLCVTKIIHLHFWPKNLKRFLRNFGKKLPEWSHICIVSTSEHQNAGQLRSTEQPVSNNKNSQNIKLKKT